LDALTRLALAVARAGTWFGGVLLILAAAIVGVEVVLRRVFNESIPGTDELSGYAMAIGVAWALAFTLLRRAHVRIDSLYVLLPVPVRAVLDIVGLAAFTGFMGLVTWYAWTGVWWRSFDVGARSLSRLEVPLWVPQALWGLGLILFLLCALLLLVRSILALVRGEPHEVQRLIGSRSALEDTAEEVEDATARLRGTRPR
jgi:TRAP-type C4-dicarboxylate transport system permease small subunit